MYSLAMVSANGQVDFRSFSALRTAALAVPGASAASGAPPSYAEAAAGIRRQPAPAAGRPTGQLAARSPGGRPAACSPSPPLRRAGAPPRPRRRARTAATLEGVFRT